MTLLGKRTRTALLCGLLIALTASAFAQKKPEDKEKNKQKSISVMDSTEAQWGRRSINDSVYRDYTVNAVYFERGRQRLPDSFKMYKPKKIGEANIVRSTKTDATPTTIKVNGKDQKLVID